TSSKSRKNYSLNVIDKMENQRLSSDASDEIPENSKPNPKASEPIDPGRLNKDPGARRRLFLRRETGSRLGSRTHQCFRRVAGERPGIGGAFTLGLPPMARSVSRRFSFEYRHPRNSRDRTGNRDGKYAGSALRGLGSQSFRQRRQSFRA